MHPDPSKVDREGRTIIPKAVRRAMGLAGPGFIVWEVDGKRATVRKVKWTTE